MGTECPQRRPVDCCGASRLSSALVGRGTTMPAARNTPKATRD